MSNISNSPIQILWEDDDLIIVGKPVGMLVDAGRKDVSDDLLSHIRSRGPAYENVFAFHRLDRGTSGVVMLGKSRRFAKQITQSFEEKRIRKAYLAVVKGEWPGSLNRVDRPIGDRESVTTFRRLAVGEYLGVAASLIECLPKSGRNHQIRIHCADSGHPVLGDARYGLASKSLSYADQVLATEAALAGGVVVDFSDQESENDESANGHALHAYRLDFRHPADGREISIRCEPQLWRTSWLKDFEISAIWDQLF